MIYIVYSRNFVFLTFLLLLQHSIDFVNLVFPMCFALFFVVFIIQGDADLRNCELGARAQFECFSSLSTHAQRFLFTFVQKKIRIIYNRMEQLILFGILCLRNEIERELNGKQIKERTKLRTRWVKKCENIAQFRRFLKSLHNHMARWHTETQRERNLHMKAISSIPILRHSRCCLEIDLDTCSSAMVLTCKSVSPFEALINRICAHRWAKMSFNCDSLTIHDDIDEIMLLFSIV